jgi:hypothetical protein
LWEDEFFKHIHTNGHYASLRKKKKSSNSFLMEQAILNIHF